MSENKEDAISEIPTKIKSSRLELNVKINIKIFKKDMCGWFQITDVSGNTKKILKKNQKEKIIRAIEILMKELKR